MRHSEKKLRQLVSAKTARAMMMAVVTGLGAASAHAQQLYWDPNHAATPAGGTGTWHTSGAWSSSATSYVAADWADTATAEFPGATATLGSITLDSAASVGKLEFLNTSGSNFIIGTSTLTVGSGGISIKGTSTNQFINVPLDGTDLKINKDTTNSIDAVLALQAVNVFTGDVHLTDDNGTPAATHFMRLNINVPGAIPSTAKIYFDTTQCELTASTFAGQVSSTTENVNDIIMQGESYIGAGSLNATVFQTLAINGTMSGVSNLTFETGTGGGGGVIQINHAATYGDPTTGSVTTFNTSTSATAHGWVVWGVDNALPTSTQIQLGLNTSTFGTGVLDLAGHSQTVAALGTGIQSAGTSSQGITTSVGGTSPSALTITGSAVSTFKSTIGVTTTGIIPAGSTANGNNISLTLSNTHTGVLNLTGINTYSRGTNVNGGTLLANSTNSTGNGTVTVASGAQLGGSGTIAGAVVSTGTFLPGESVTAGTTAFNGTITTGGIGTLSIGGGLTLNDTAVANYDFTATTADKVAVTGALNLPASGTTETININYIPGATIANGTFALISYTTGSLTAGQFGTLKFGNGLQTETIGGATLSLVNGSGAVNLVVTGGVNSLFWKGPAGGSGTWDMATSNWTNSGASTTYSETPSSPLVTFDDTAQGSGTLTVTISNGGTAVHPFLTNFNNSAKNYVIAGATAGDVIGGTGGVIKNGSGSVTFSGVESYTGDTTINAGTLVIGASGVLGTDGSHNVSIGGTGTLNIASGGTAGSGKISINSGGTLSIAQAAAIASNASLTLNTGTLKFTAPMNVAPGMTVASPSYPSTGGTLDIGANLVTFSGGITNGSGTAGDFINLAATTGTLVLPTPNASYSGGWKWSAGTIALDAVDGTGISGLGVGSATNFGTNSVQMSGTATLKLDGVTNGPLNWGDPTGTASSPELFMDGGTTLLATGTTSIGRSSFPLNFIVNGTTAKTIDIKTVSSSDVLTIKGELAQDTAGPAFGGQGGLSGDLIRVNNGGGQGTVVLGSGLTGNTFHAFAGTWNVNGGILQIGPTTNSGGESLNALGYVGYDTGGGFFSADPEDPSPVVVNTGGTLALAVSAHNATPSQIPPNPTPDYLRAPVELAGGSLAVSQLTTAYYGGNLKVDAGTSKVLVYDPRSTATATHVQLVGGLRNMTNATPKYAAGFNLLYTTTWIGTLEVDPGTGGAVGGSFDIIRGDGNFGDGGNGGTVAVTNGATLQIDSGATVNLGGAGDSLSDGTHSVNVTTGNAALFHVTSGTKNVGTIEGTGTTTVDSGVTLFATHIRQNTLTVNGTARVRADGTLAATSVVTTLNATSGKLDLSNNKLVVKNGNVGTFVSGAYTGISGLAHAGRNTGAWDGPTGLVTSQALAASRVAGLAVASAADVKDFSTSTTALFGGQTVHASDVLVMYTYNGDANLDGRVNADDYFTIDKNYNKSGSLFGYTKGDFNYDGVINGDDYAFIDAGFAGQGSQLPGAPAPGGVSAVPEPASVAMIAFGLSGLGLRRRRR